MRYSWLFVAMLEFVRNWLINFFDSETCPKYIKMSSKCIFGLNRECTSYTSQ